ncbi:DUF6542 domain-containing protein [Prescottella equi]|uniref:DUF6542 domain-containing protein n=1 Tax=Rhodococcus hoagii TaxID=43767 RepID=UPI001EEA0F4C|nr:DUF6542 domain-containing protein [Prescottella equi]
MSATQRARSGVPLDQRSALPTVPGIPAWGAVAVAAGATFLGFAFDAVSGRELTSAFSAMYFLGCVLAVLAVRKRGMFTAVVQPPLLLFVAVPLGAQFLTDGAGTGLKDMAINVAYPLVNRFPLMLAATVVVGLIAAARVFLVQARPSAPARPRDRRAEARPARARRARNDHTATRDDRTTVFDPVTDDRRAPTRAARPSRPAAEPATAHIPAGSPGNPYPGREGRAYEDSPPRRDYGRREPLRSESGPRESARREPIPRSPRREAAYRDPVQRDPVAARPRRTAEVPAHPIPEVRYRDRSDQPPFEG